MDERIARIVGEAVRVYTDCLQNEYNVLGVYIFGSYAKGNVSDDSDIDIAVISDSFTGDPVDDLTALLLLKADIDNRIEPHPFLPSDFTADNPFAKEIIETGIRIA